MDKDYILHKWLNNEASPAEIEQLKTDAKYASFIKIAETSSSFDVAEMDTEANFKAISNELKPVQQLQKPRVFSIVWKVAAVFALLLVGYYYTTTLDTTVTTQVAQTKNFLLPDGSKVALNAASTLTYNKNNWTDNRELTLNGEAYFSVLKGNKFSVKTTQGIITVLGTQFNVAARDNFLTVNCYEGLVSVQFNDTLIKLPAGKKIEIENKKLIANENTVNQSPLWLQHESSFNNVTLQRVIDALKRQYEVKIKLKDVNLEKRFTGTFTHKNLELALKSICEPLQLTYKINKNAVVIIDAKNSK